MWTGWSCCHFTQWFPPQQPEDCFALSPCPTLWEVTGDGLQWPTLYLEALESCCPEKVPASGLPWGPILLARGSTGCGFVHDILSGPKPKNIYQPTLHTDLKPPPMLSSVPEDTLGGLQAATSPLPECLVLKQNPWFAPLPKAQAECFPDPPAQGSTTIPSCSPSTSKGLGKLGVLPKGWRHTR